jgi:hypothetical protein
VRAVGELLAFVAANGPAGAEGDVVRFRYAQSKIDIAPDTILIDREAAAVIEEQQQWVRSQFPDIDPRFLFTGHPPWPPSS